ncbi:MAG: bifunctional aspartate kinase/homoserine dehydrogenase I [Myxococcota bacterium]|nr:bifunctional aspartate kinase/homoserine dehydrogenase I [Myxococcota bacterium]
MSRVEVHKFGGTSVRDADRMRHDAALIAAAASEAAIVVVASAMTGVTDELIAAASAAMNGEPQQASALIAGIQQRHFDALNELDGAGPESAAVRKAISEICAELDTIVDSIGVLEELTHRVRDRIIASGEKLSIRLLAVALRKVGLSATPMDADAFLETDARHGEANPLGVVADRTIAAAIRPVLSAGSTPVVTGFCGLAPDGSTTTLGRGGSDYTATLIASAIDADEVTIWTDVDGVFSADPRVVPEARCVDQLNYREAAELSFYGAKVLHQRTMIPVAQKRIPVRTRNSFRPEAAGTLVNNRFTPGSHPVKAISAVRGQALVSIEGKGMSGVPGVAARVFQCLATERISVTMISQSSSESSISLVVPEAQADAAAAALKAEFRTDLSHGDIEEITLQPHVGLVAAVGLGMAQAPGVAGRVFQSLGAAKVNVLAIAQGSSELNISLAVGADQIPLAVRTLHAEFGLHRKDTGTNQLDGLDLMLLGCGAIGRALIGQLAQRRDHIAQRFGLSVRIVSIADRSGFLLNPAGLTAEQINGVVAAKSAGTAVAALPGGVAAKEPAAMVEAALSYRLSRPILVDVSDSDDAHEAFLSALARGCDVATANKKPLADNANVYRTLSTAAASNGRVIRSEATVGAGLPVIDSLDILLSTGDRLHRAQGCLSGTLGYLMSELEQGVPFSVAVRTAVQLGYTEPDPVADLSGVDVARKATILARLADLPSASKPVALEGLVDSAHAGLPLADLMTLLETMDDDIAARVQSAKADGNVLRFVATVDAESIAVGPVAVPKDSALGGLQGSDNMIVFESDRYNDRPLVVTGPGAGIDVTAMGVLGDILRIAAQRSQP